MAEGGCPPPAPADPDVRNSRIRLLGPWHRYAGAHPRAAVSDDSPLAAGLALRRPLARCPDRLSARQSMIRSAASLRRVPVGRVPRLPRYYQRTPTSRRPSRRASFSFAWRYHLVRPVRSLGDGHAPGPRLLFNAAVRAALSGGDDETSQVPGRPLPACPALRPRRNQPHQTVSARQWCLPLLSQRRLPRCLRISWLNHAACKAPCVRFADGVAPGTTQHSVPAGRSTLAGRDSHPLGRIEGFRHVATCHPPSPSFAWRKTSPAPTSNARGAEGFEQLTQGREVMKSQVRCQGSLRGFVGIQHGGRDAPRGLSCE